MNNVLIAIILSSVMIACTGSKNLSQVNWDDTTFDIRPHIVQKGDDFFLRYRMKKIDSDIQNRWQLGSKTANGKGYYFFVGKSSFREFYNLVERPLKRNRLVEYVKNDSIFWLNPNGTDKKLKFVTNP